MESFLGNLSEVPRSLFQDGRAFCEKAMLADCALFYNPFSLYSLFLQLKQTIGLIEIAVWLLYSALVKGSCREEPQVPIAVGPAGYARLIHRVL